MAVIKNYLKEHKLESQVFFHGDLCTGNCAKGPILKINGRTYENVDTKVVVDILNDIFMK
jgi:NADH:ubiquinone oxidoreductase subunit E